MITLKTYANRLGRATAITMLFVAALMSTASGARAAAVRAIAVDPTSGPPLTTIKITGTSFCPSPCGNVNIQIGSLYVASGVTVSTAGRFSKFVRVPGTVRPGPVDVTASQTDREGNTASASTQFSVTISQPAPTHYTPPPTVQPPGGLPPPPPASSATPRSHQPTLDRPSSSTGTSSSPTEAAAPAPTAAATSHRTDSTTLPIALTVIGCLLAAGLLSLVWWRRHGP